MRVLPAGKVVDVLAPAAAMVCVEVNGDDEVRAGAPRGRAGESESTIPTSGTSRVTASNDGTPHRTARGADRQ